MAWTTPITFTSGNVLTAAQLNANRDNLNETAVAKATGGFGIIVTTGLNQVTQRTPASGEALAENSTPNITYSFFASGPLVQITTGSLVWVFLTAMLSNDTGGFASKMSIDDIGSHAPGDSTAMTYESSQNGDACRATTLLRIAGLTPGVNSFTAVYRVTGGTGRFSHRRVDVLPLA